MCVGRSSFSLWLRAILRLRAIALALRVGLAFAAAHVSFPFTRPLIPYTVRVPPSATNSTSRVSPGSKRTAVPAAIFRRIPYAAARSKSSARFTSKKWQCDPTWIGRSPRLVTVTRAVERPSLGSIGSERRKYSPGIIVLSDRLMDGDQFGSVRKGSFDLDFTYHFGHAFHD